MCFWGFLGFFSFSKNQKPKKKQKFQGLSGQEPLTKTKSQVLVFGFSKNQKPKVSGSTSQRPKTKNPNSFFFVFWFFLKPKTKRWVLDFGFGSWLVDPGNFFCPKNQKPNLTVGFG